MSVAKSSRTRLLYRQCRICKVREGGRHKMSCNFFKYNLPYEWRNVMATEPEHENTEDVIPVTEPGETTTWSDSREDGHDD